MDFSKPRKAAPPPPPPSPVQPTTRAAAARLGALAAAEALDSANDQPDNVPQKTVAHWRGVALDRRLHVLASPEMTDLILQAFGSAAFETMKAAGQSKWKPPATKYAVTPAQARKNLKRAGYGHNSDD